jgi:hypothetical protein
LLAQHAASTVLGKTWRMLRTRRRFLLERAAAVTVIMGVRRWLLATRCRARAHAKLELLAKDAKQVHRPSRHSTPGGLRLARSAVGACEQGRG